MRIVNDEIEYQFSDIDYIIKGRCLSKMQDKEQT